MTTRIEIEDIETTKSEKLLAVVLAVFLLMGSIWAYQEIDDAIQGPSDPEAAFLTGEEEQTLSAFQQAERRLAGARNAQTQARDTLELAREEYRTALDAGRPAPRLERAYANARADFAASGEEVAQARDGVVETRPAAEAAERKLSGEVEKRFEYEALVVFLLRALFGAAMLVAGILLLGRLRRRGSRYLPVAFALIGTATILLFVLASDYVTDYVDPLDLGPLVLSLFGIAVTLAAFWWLQRYLARRLPSRRVRRSECPFCGYPTGRGAHCEGCGRGVLAGCTACGRERRVGTHHCAVCGHA